MTAVLIISTYFVGGEAVGGLANSLKRAGDQHGCRTGTGGNHLVRLCGVYEMERVMTGSVVASNSSWERRLGESWIKSGRGDRFMT